MTIIEYHRPQTLVEALELLARPQPTSLPLAGGTILNRMSDQPFAAIDLQALGLSGLKERGNSLEIGAMVTLQNLLESQIPSALKNAILHEASHNLRQVATIGGTLAAADGCSPLTTILLALDSQLTIQPGSQILGLGDLLPVRAQRLPGCLITQVSIPIKVKLAYEYVARTPADLPIVSAALACWPSGRTRLALGGHGRAPSLAFDGNDALGIAAAARSAYSQASDEWASAEYRAEIAGCLAERCLNNLAD